MLRKEKWFFAILFAIYLVLFFSFRFSEHPVSGWKGIIASDGKGYYSYLVHACINHDMTYGADEHLYAAANENNQYVNRFYCGTAILELPFFSFGYLTAMIFDYPLDGYSKPFAFFIGFSSIFYSLLGLIFLYLILKKYIECSVRTAMWITVLTFAGTNLIFYSVIYGSFSHSFSFFAITLFVYQLYRLKEQPRTSRFVYTALLAGLIVVIRPVNALVLLLIPAVFTNAKEFLTFIRTQINYKLILYALAFMFPFFIQCWLWFAQTGNFFEWPYIQEGFYFNNPQITDVFFGFRRGLFIYCPLLLIALAGIYSGMKTRPWQTAWLVVFLFFFTYVTASWWHWTYGDTFGMRPYNDILVVFMIIFAFLLTTNRLKNIILLVCVGAGILNLLFAYQFSLGILNISTMDNKRFFELFMEFDADKRTLYGGENDIAPFAPNGFITLQETTELYNHLPKKYYAVQQQEWPGGLQFVYPELKKPVRHAWVEISYNRKITSETSMKDVLFVVQASNSDTTHLYSTFHVKEFPAEKTGEWKQIKHSLWLPDSFNANDKIGLYLWNRGKENFMLDDYRISVKIPRFGN